MQNGRCRVSGRRMPRARLLSLAAAALAAATLQAGQQSTAPDVPVFRATTRLLTVDAVVTDKDGHHVTDLEADEFEITYDARRQQLQHAVYVRAGESSVALSQDSPAHPEPQGENITELSQSQSAAALTGALTTPASKFGRVMALVVDDLGLSFESTVAVRNALRKFIDGQVQDGDLVAILRTAGGIGALQQFTTDRRLLHAAADRVQWTILSRSGVTAFAPVVPSAEQRSSGTAEIDDENTIEGLRTSMLAAASLQALEYVIRGVEHLPGRKAVVFFSEGFRLIGRQQGFGSAGNSRVWSAFTKVMDRANRAGVVVYTVDARGLVTGLLTAEDNPQARPVAGGPGGPSSAVAQQQTLLGSQEERHAFLIDSQEGLAFVAEQTGGFSVLNTNDLNLGLQQILRDLQGYYLLGFTTSELMPQTWDPGRVRIRVTRPGLRVRTRQGLFGPADPRTKESEPQPDSLLIAAMSPFNAGAISLRLTSLFGHDPETGPYIRSMLFIDPNALSSTLAADGRHEAKLEVLQVAVGDNGEVLGNWRRTITLRLTDEQFEMAREQGVVYGTRMAVKKPGAYQVRTALQDLGSTAIGSASQFVEVPEVGKGRLALSGVLLQAKTGGKTATETAATELEFTETGDTVSDVLGRPTLRIFGPGTDVVFAYEVYDGLDEKKAQALEMRTTLLRNGRVVYEGPTEPVVAPKTEAKIRVIPIGGLLSLGHDMPPGTYTLEVTVGADRKRRASQWVDLEVRTP